MENELKEAAFKYNFISPQEYLAMERASEEKHEYYHGQVMAMAGPGIENIRISLNHIRICRNITSGIDFFLQGKDCEILPTDMRVATPTQDAYMYPDALIVCGEPQLKDNDADILLNPAVIFEILSLSARGIDKGRKLFFYQDIPYVKEYIMIDSMKRFIQLARKQEDGGWLLEEIKESSASLFIRTIDFLLPLDQIYKDTGL